MSFALSIIAAALAGALVAEALIFALFVAFLVKAAKR